MALFRRKAKGERVPAAPAGALTAEAPATFLPRRARRFRFESFFMRMIATGGIVGIGTAVAAIMGSQDVAYWITGIVVSGVSVILAAILWSSRTL